jgi:diguanylate cyclase (GGDEF)-like protein
MSKSPDFIRTLMRRRQGEPEAPFSAAEVDKLLNQFKQLEQQVESQKEVIGALQKQALADPATGLANRRTLESELDKSLSTARRYGRRHALIWIEIADYAALEALGEETIAHVLKHTARLLRQNIRATDIASRPHDVAPVFACILNELRMADNAAMRASEISHVLNGTPCVTPRATLHLTAQVGHVVFGADDSVTDVIAKAQKACHG